MFRKLGKAYNAGWEESKTVENLFWFGHQLTSDNKEYFYPREFWDTRRKRLQLQYQKMGILQKVAYKLGFEGFIFSVDKHLPLARPLY